MKIPERVKIGGVTYDVLRKVERIKYGPDYIANIVYGSGSIELGKFDSEQMEQRTFLHEVIHGIFNHLGYIKHDEKRIDELANALYALIIDNPEIFTE